MRTWCVCSSYTAVLIRAPLMNLRRKDMCICVKKCLFVMGRRYWSFSYSLAMQISQRGLPHTICLLKALRSKETKPACHRKGSILEYSPLHLKQCADQNGNVTSRSIARGKPHLLQTTFATNVVSWPYPLKGSVLRKAALNYLAQKQSDSNCPTRLTSNLNFTRKELFSIFTRK